MRETAIAVSTALTPHDRWNALRRYYAEITPLINAAPATEWAVDPYEVDWLSVFTPIEFGIWQDIRALGAVLYPQYPIGKYFADFASPACSIVIECDGFHWHQDKEKDAKREQYMRERGWRIYRITGRACMDTGAYVDGETGEERHHETEGERLLRQLSLVR